MRLRAKITDHIDRRGFAKSESGELFEVRRKDFRTKHGCNALQKGVLLDFVAVSNCAFHEDLWSGEFRDADLPGGHRNPRPPKHIAQELKYRRAKDIVIIQEQQ